MRKVTHISNDDPDPVSPTAARDAPSLYDPDPAVAARRRREVIGQIAGDEDAIEAAIAKGRRGLESAFQDRVREAAQKLYDDNFPTLQKEQNKASETVQLYTRLINDRRPIFTAAEYTTILACLHPDNSASNEKRETAFRAFSAMKLQLT